MFEEIIVAGAGGQGVLVLGEVLAIAAVKAGNKATWLPAYGPEMRGGTANCSVVLSSKEIGSPLVQEPSLLVCFNQPSITKFGPATAKGGKIFANADTIEEYPQMKEGVEIIKIKVNSLAAALGDERALNMVMLGAVLKKSAFVTLESCALALRDIWGAKAEELLPTSLKAMRSGQEAVAGQA
ncbi:MAG: 2-oxoacid:acceptor oxidoreductase family protein [Deltaproteobacteria bacterium]|jgi:2-oxoglutarate ferredoxin oxidoreductase subunit gamma|nr:2-oxoacid:acceptor oxidoreductase family protein [Deltaproteobacteria bacterium]